MTMTPLLTEILLAAVPAILAITLHEAAHGYAALLLGDDTAKRLGRLSVNPLRHIDRIGTLILPGLLLMSQLLTMGRVGFMFGWAKPVPVVAERLRHPRQDMALVAAAGPLTNFMLAWISALLLHLVTVVPPAQQSLAVDLLRNAILFNLGLGLFNLLPIPPLDGGRIAVGLLPLPLARRWAGMERGGIVLVLLLIYLLPALSGRIGVRLDPVGWGLNRVMAAALRVVLQLAGIHDGG